MRIAQQLGGDALDEPVLHRAGGLAGGEAGAVADAEDVRVDRHRGVAERDVEHHVRGLAPDARQRLQLFAR